MLAAERGEIPRRNPSKSRNNISKLNKIPKIPVFCGQKGRREGALPPLDYQRRGEKKQDRLFGKIISKNGIYGISGIFIRKSLFLIRFFDPGRSHRAGITGPPERSRSRALGRGHKFLWLYG